MGKGERLAVISALLGAISGFSNAVAQSTVKGDSTPYPKACYFFEPRVSDTAERRSVPERPTDERAYDASRTDVYQVWCSGKHSTPVEKKIVIDAMVERWKAVWDRPEPFNVEFHETASIDLLALMGLTHELPSQMAADPEFVRQWSDRCAQSCFTFWSVPRNPREEHGLAMLLWLRNDVLDHLKQESASGPVIAMLQDAQFRLVD